MKCDLPEGAVQMAWSSMWLSSASEKEAPVSLAPAKILGGEFNPGGRITAVWEAMPGGGEAPTQVLPWYCNPIIHQLLIAAD